MFTVQCSIVILGKEPNLLRSGSMRSEKSRSDQLEERLIEFAVRIITLAAELPRTAAGRHIALQMLRSGTAAAPNYAEARGAESRADFVHKLHIALKELRESRSWIRLIIKAELLPEHRMKDLLDECCQLCNILGQSVATAKGKERGQD